MQTAFENLCQATDCSNKAKNKYKPGFCAKHYYRYHNHGSPDTLVKRTNGEVLRILNDVAFTDDYVGCNDPLGWSVRPLVKLSDGRQMKASRYVWSLRYGEPPSFIFVLHSCDNEMCVNIRHLHLGDQQQNMQEASIRGRSKNGNTRLTEDIVKSIRQEVQHNTHEVVAQKWGVTRQTVGDIVNRKTWKRVI